MNAQKRLLALFLSGSILPMVVLLFPALQDSLIARFFPGAEPLGWPSWTVGERLQVVFDPVEISVAILYAVSLWSFVRFVQRYPATRLYWIFWSLFLLSALALFLMGRPHTAVVTLGGLALLGRCNDAKFHRIPMDGEVSGL